MRHKKVRELRVYAIPYYLTRYQEYTRARVTFKRFFRRVKEQYNIYGNKVIDALMQGSLNLKGEHDDKRIP